MIFLPKEEIETRAFIDGCYQATTGGIIEKLSPIDGSKIPNLHAASVDDINIAVSAASKAFELGLWRNKSFKNRKLALLKWADLIEADIENLSCNCKNLELIHFYICLFKIKIISLN